MRRPGLYYYGARYYDPKVSVWLSVDPKAESFPSFSSYTMLMNNPLMMIDPGGDSTSFATPEDRAFVEDLVDPNSANYDKKFADKYQDLVDSEENYHFQSGNYDPKNGFSGWTGPDKNAGDILVYFTKDGPYASNPHTGQSEYSALYEETFHAWDYETGGLDFNNPTALDEAQAWRFASNAPGTTDLTMDGYGKAISTVMKQFRDASDRQVAHCLKYGLPTTSRGVGFDKAPGKGVYHNLPLGF